MNQNQKMGSSHGAPTFGWFLVGLAYASLFEFGFVDSARGPIFPDLLKDYGLSDTLGGFFFLIASAAALLNNLLLFRWIERIGAYRTTQVYSVAQAIGLLIIGFSPSYAITLLGAAVVGTSLGGLGISVNVLVAEGAPAHRRRQALSGLHCMYGVSSLIAPLMVSQFYHYELGWRAVMGWLALGPVAVLGLSFLGRGDGQVVHGKKEQAAAGGSSRPPWALGLFFATIGTLYVVAEISISTRLVLFARRDWSYDIDRANLILALYFLGLFLGRFVSAVFQLPWKSQTILIFSAAFGLLFYMMGLSLHPLWLAAAGFPLSVFYPCLIALINDEQGRLSGYITSWCITLQAFGVMAMHFLLGGLTDAFGLGRALWLGPGVLLLVLICLGAKPAFAPASGHSS